MSLTKHPAKFQSHGIRLSDTGVQNKGGEVVGSGGDEFLPEFSTFIVLFGHNSE